MGKLRNVVKKYGSKVAVGGSLMMASAASFADTAADIGAASAAAQTNMGLTIGAVIGLSALSFGVGAIVMWLRK